MLRLVTIAALILAASLSLLPYGSAKSAGKATFTKDVAPIFFAKCAECHRAGETAPMSLLSYKDSRPWAKSIREKVVNRTMPPWHADSHFGQWANDRRLSQKEIDTITAWVDAGAPEGNPADLPPLPKYSEGWNIPTPDVVLKMDEPFKLEASGADEYQYFEIPTNFTEDKYVQMIEARPGNRKIVHHILAFVVPAGAPSLSKVKKEMRDKAIEMSLMGSPWYRDGFLIRTRKETPYFDNAADIPQKLKGYNEVDDFLTAYVPGHSPDKWPVGIAKKIPAGSTLRLQIHYSKVAGSVQTDQSEIGIVFATQKPEKLLSTKSAANMFFKIPANAENHLVTAEWEARSDTYIYSFSPHMHYRGKSMKYEATYPDGKSEVLLNVPNYDFAWQTTYVPTSPKFLPKGSRLKVTAGFDNSAKNKYNPDPSKDVRYGEPTYDEMMIGFFDYVRAWPAAVKVDTKLLDDYVGKYDLGQGRTVSVIREGDKLFSIGTDNARYLLIPIGKDRFRLEGVDVEVSFVRNERGEVVERIREGDGGLAHSRKLAIQASRE